MDDRLSIRPERLSDIKAIEKVTIEAFKNQAHSKQTEHKIVFELRKSKALKVSLIAEIDDYIVGHIAFSEVVVNGESSHWYGLAPVSVLPQYQRQGIGSGLIVEGIEAIKQLEANGCVLLGAPGFYGNFGFKSVDYLKLDGVPAECFQALLISGDWVSGHVEYHKIFAESG